MDPKTFNWLQKFDERQQKEITFSTAYVESWSHGTDGHNAKVIIAKMANLLNELELEISQLKGSNPPF